MPTLSDNQIEAISEHVIGALRALGFDKSTADEVGALVDAAIAYGLAQPIDVFNPEVWHAHGAIEGGRASEAGSLPHVAALLDPNDDQVNGVDGSLPPFGQLDENGNEI